VSWLVIRDGPRVRWGGDLRRRHIFDGFVERSDAVSIEDRHPAAMRTALRPLRPRRWQVWRSRPRVLSAELLTDAQLATLHGADPIAVDVHDEPVLQPRSLGVRFEPAQEAALAARFRANLRAFRLAVAPSAGLARLAGLDLERTIIASNGTETSHVRPLPWPDRPMIGMVSGAAPNRGIEALIEAARSLRTEFPTLGLDLWLTATGEGSAAYLDRIREFIVDSPWISLDSASYENLSEALGRSTVLTVPNPVDAYGQTILPIKLFDSMAAGRPVVVTPGAEMRRVVESREVGVVAAGDRPDDLAAAIGPLLSDPARARKLGANARRVAETEYDWAVIGRRLAAEITSRVR
jgi:glycosyltransferase involved in cell wall biosynthesis